MATDFVTGGRFELVPDDSLPWIHAMTAKAASQNFFASIAYHRNVSAWRFSKVVLRARIQNSMDAPCSACRESARDYELADLPSVPIHACRNINTVGCRCVAIASRIKGINL
jgi:hypothetical protein